MQSDVNNMVISLTKRTILAAEGSYIMFRLVLFVLGFATIVVNFGTIASGLIAGLAFVALFLLSLPILFDLGLVLGYVTAYCYRKFLQSPQPAQSFGFQDAFINRDLDVLREGMREPRVFYNICYNLSAIAMSLCVGGIFFFAEGYTPWALAGFLVLVLLIQSWMIDRRYKPSSRRSRVAADYDANPDGPVPTI